MTTTRSVDDPTNAAPSLLTLPKTDFGKKEIKDKLILIELPAEIKISDFHDEGTGKVKIVGGAGDNDDGSSSISVRLVTTKKGTFELTKIETSNTLIMIPPLIVDDDSAPASGDSSDKTLDGCKRARASLVEMPARKIDSSFMELQCILLDRNELNEILKKYEYDPYDVDNSIVFGKSVQELAQLLLVSDLEILEALQNMQAFTVTSNNENRYCYLSEEVQKEVLEEMFAHLVEDGVEDLDKFHVGSCIQSVMLKLQSGNADGNDMRNPENVIRHCLKLLTKAPFRFDDGMLSDDAVIQLNVEKIALIMAHQLFNERQEPWLLSEFEDEWHGRMQTRMPGTGAEFRPSMDLLRGVALKRTETNDIGGMRKNREKNIYLTYFPENKMPLDIAKRFGILFSEEDQWALEDLAPYVKPLVKCVNMSQAEILLKYTRVIIDQNEKQWYQKR